MEKNQRRNPEGKKLESKKFIVQQSNTFSTKLFLTLRCHVMFCCIIITIHNTK
jgi:hypothetical protein